MPASDNGGELSLKSLTFGPSFVRKWTKCFRLQGGPYIDITRMHVTFSFIQFACFGVLPSVVASLPLYTIIFIVNNRTKTERNIIHV